MYTDIVGSTRRSNFGGQGFTDVLIYAEIEDFGINWLLLKIDILQDENYKIANGG